MKKSYGERLLLILIEADGLPAPVEEYRFMPSRRWRADFAYPLLHVLIEVEGGTWGQGRHVRGLGYEADCEKYNEAAMQGWRVLRFTTGMVEDGRALGTIRRLFNGSD